jgi:hypothetical protein
LGRNDLIEYLCIPSWDDHQEKRTNRDGKVWRPPWIKVRCDNSDDYAYSRLTIRQRGLLMELWKLAGKLNNRIPNDPVWISRACQSEEDVSADLKELISSVFIQPYGVLS